MWETLDQTVQKISRLVLANGNGLTVIITLDYLAAQVPQSVHLIFAFGSLGKADKSQFFCKGNDVPYDGDVFLPLAVRGNLVHKALVDFKGVKRHPGQK